MAEAERGWAVIHARLLRESDDGTCEWARDELAVYTTEAAARLAVQHTAPGGQWDHSGPPVEDCYCRRDGEHWWVMQVPINPATLDGLWDA